jgi:HTH-type transcriptional repressor of NAD biosynthesis genes
VNGRFQRGLVVGKFCPLHLGHMHLLDAAARACEQLIIISYTKPEFDGCAPPVREGWLRALYPAATVLVVDDAALARQPGAPRTVPHNDADAELHREFVGWLCTRVLGVKVNAVFTSEDYGDGFAAALAVYFGHQVAHVSVDEARVAVPVSGTRARAHLFAERRFLPPLVYASLVRRVVILGAESSGKSTLAKALAARLETCWAPEFGRELWEEKDGALEFDDMLHIAQTQVERETNLCRDARDWLVCDTSSLTTWWYSLEMFGQADPRLAALVERPYDKVLLCAPDCPFEQDGTRRDEAHRGRQHAWYLEQLARRGLDHLVLRGSVEQRLAHAIPYLTSAARTRPN